MICEECGTNFPESSKAKRFCSEKCRRKAEKRRWKQKKLHAVQRKRYEETGLMPGERLCKTCGTKFEVKFNGEAYCSEPCKEVGYEASRKRGKEAARRRAYEQKQNRVRSCEWCEESFKSCGPQKYCSSKCKREARAHASRLGTYDLSRSGYDALVERSGGMCEICQTKEAVHIDHCHDTEAVRGLLCQQCNHGLGNFKDNVALLNRASEYLSRKIANEN